MAVASKVYPNGINSLCQGDITWQTTGGTALVAVLVQDSYTYAAAHNARDDLTEASGGTYAEQALTELDPTVDTGNDQVEFDTSDATVTFSSPANAQTIGGVAVCSDGGGGTSTDLLICICDFTGGNVTSDGSNDIVVTPGAEGWFKIAS